MVVLAVALTFSVTALAAFLVHTYIVGRRRSAVPPLPPPAPSASAPGDTIASAAMREWERGLVSVTELLGKTVQETAEAIGKAVQTAQHSPEAPAPQTVRRWTLDPDVQEGLVDDTDPTDSQPWLAERREDVSFLAHGESPIPGVELRP